MNTKIHFGTAGWFYDDWVGPFYPTAQSKDFDLLKYYSECFNCVEVNVTYYRYMPPNIVKSWVNKISDKGEFSFTIKAHQDFTHKRKYDNNNIKEFSSTLDILSKASVFGGILFQFPYSYPFNNTNAGYISKLREVFSAYSFFLEVRHASWFNENAINLMGELGITLCTIDQPQVGQTLDFNPIVTSNRSYFRFHGRNVKAWKESINNYGKDQSYKEQSERYNYLYTPGELVEVSQKIKEKFEKIKEMHIIMNNHPNGNAVANAFELMKMLDDKIKLNIPQTTREKFIRLKKA